MLVITPLQPCGATQFSEPFEWKERELRNGRVRIVVTCTDGKTRPALAPLRLRDHKVGDDRVDRWVDALRSTPSPTLPALELYKGEHWSVVRTLPARSAETGWEVDLWVASAGYGLIPVAAPIKPYAATFANGQPDSVSVVVPRRSTSEMSRRWWSDLARWPGPAMAPRSIRDLAKAEPDAPLVFVGSASYLKAVATDLQLAADELGTAGSLLVVSGGADSRVVQDHRLPVDSRLLHALGGSRISLNVRVAARLVATAADHRFDLGACRKRLTDLLVLQPAAAVYHRLPLTDDQVRSFIEDELEQQPGQSATALLRRLRDSERACEQKRFGALYRDVVERITA